MFSCSLFIQLKYCPGFGLTVEARDSHRPQQWGGSSKQQASAPLRDRKSHLDRQNETCTSGMSRLTCALSCTLTHRHTHAQTFRRLHSLSCKCSDFHKWTDTQTWSNSGTSSYMQFPVPPSQLLFPLKHCLFIPHEHKKCCFLQTYTQRKEGTSSHREIAE